ncbi:hypothetical protein GCM10010331_76670 [Streptomyces xanthochromogenes]|uniref:STAS domain-containing protein n=1 Tax=Streptomyces xanthochromogenes TaxID=67384 RepID=UPI001673A97E|nr:STAS domain-containing protein [Streptomyces xanthochromogenes]GHB77550.1 hypothetical protein GCM10010331_76670 [Streptomyces xanthochromogenes]
MTLGNRGHEESLCRVVRAHGELDIATRSAFDRSLRLRLRHGPCPGLVADLTAVTFMDCSALSVLCDVHGYQWSQGGWLRLVYTRSNIALLLAGTGLAEVFPRYATVRDALMNRRYAQSAQPVGRRKAGGL